MKCVVHMYFIFKHWCDINVAKIRMSGNFKTYRLMIIVVAQMINKIGDKINEHTKQGMWMPFNVKNKPKRRWNVSSTCILYPSIDEQCD